MASSRDSLVRPASSASPGGAGRNASQGYGQALRRSLESAYPNLPERLKELHCLVTVDSLLRDGDAPQDEALDAVCRAVPAGFQFPEQVGVELRIGEARYATPTFRGTEWRLTSEVIGDGFAGELVVAYQDVPRLGDAALFLPEEEPLLAAIAERIGEELQRRRSQHALQQSEAYIRALAKSGGLALGVTDAECGVLRTRDELCDLLGREHEAVAGASLLDFLSPDDREPLRTLVERLLQSPTEFLNARVEVLHPSGERRIVDLTLHDLREDAAVGGLVWVFEDVTERVRTKQALMDSEQRFRQLVESTSDWVWEVDAKGAYTYVSPKSLELLGYAPEELLGRTPFELMPPDERQRFRKVVQAHMDPPRGLHNEPHLSLHRDGKPVWLETSGVPLFHLDGTLRGFRGIDRDVTERVVAEAQLARVNRALRVISAANQSVLRSTSESELLDEACRIALEEGGYHFVWIGYRQDDADRTVSPVAHRSVALDAVDTLDVTWGEDERGQGPAGTAIRTGLPQVVRDIAQAGAQLWTRDALGRGHRAAAAIPLTSEGVCFGALNVYSLEAGAFDEEEVAILCELGADLSHGIAVHRGRRRHDVIEANLQRSEKLRAVGQLAGGIAHDFNNYLSVMMSLTDLLLADPELDEGHREDLREMRKVSERSAALTQQLLAFSRQQPTRSRSVDLHEAVSRISILLTQLLGERVQVRPDLEQSPGPVLVDPGHLEQILLNLAVNARDAMPQGGTLTLSASADEDDPTAVCLQIRDTGVGMDPQTRARIFEPFFTTKPQGTGLGLATVYGLVEQNGGRVSVESAVGLGTTFFIRLPRAEEPATPTLLPSSPGELAPVTAPRTILLVEDQPVVRRTARRVLTRCGYHVIEASCVAEALAISDEVLGSIDLLLTDMGLPDGNGRNVADGLRQRRPDLKVLFTSGYVGAADGATPAVGADENFLPKPFAAEGLARAVRSALG